MSLDPSLTVSIRDQWAKQHADHAIRSVWNAHVRRSQSPGPDGFLRHEIPPDGPLPQVPKPSPSDEHGALKDGDYKVCIIGAGAAGLFTGLILDYLQQQCAFEISYDILEAATSDRVGGRLYTYNFVADPPNNPQGPHDYYDVGAMRFPNNPVMGRTFDLFAWLNMTEQDLKSEPPIGSLVTYTMNGTVEPWCFNDVNAWGTSESVFGSKDTFQVNQDESIPDDVFQYSPDDVIESIIANFRESLQLPGNAGWDLLMQYDSYSTRQYLANAPPAPLPPGDISPSKRALEDPVGLLPYNYDTIEWLETFNGGTSWYDQAFSETVLESLDFNYQPNMPWYCVLGGAQQLAINMEDKLQQKPTYSATVTSVKVNTSNTNQLDVGFEDSSGQSQTVTYDGVFSSTTLGCLQQIDVSGAGLNYGTKQAIRSLGYGASSKVGIKFKTAWWINSLPTEYQITQGGLGHSDLTIRTCVYPSYNIYDSSNEPAVLLCSYTWQQDAQRIASLISGADDLSHAQVVQEELPLRALLTKELARLHTIPGQLTYDQAYQMIDSNWLDHYAHDWYHDPNTVGAFAFFRPQQFSQMWGQIIQPSGNFQIIGEAASPHHAWVVGALESAVHGVHAWLGANTQIPGANEAIKILETPVSGNPFVGLPPYMDANMSGWHSLLARLHRDKVAKAVEERKS